MTQIFCAIYARVSTDSQDLNNQLLQLRAYAHAKGWKVADEYTDQESGARAKRPGLLRLLEDSTSNDFSIVLVWSLDRFSRTTMFSTCRLIAQLREASVDLVSVQEPWFNTAGPAGDILLAFAAWMADQERVRVSSRVKAGLERAEREGRKGGRRKEIIPAAVIAALQSDTPIGVIDTNISRATLYRLRSEMKGTTGKVIHKATFTGPKELLNPMGLEITDTFTVECYQHRARWNARLAGVVRNGSAPSSPLPVDSRPTLEQIKASVAALFHTQAGPWRTWQQEQQTETTTQETQTA